jgi:hypothetical protein
MAFLITDDLLSDNFKSLLVAFTVLVAVIGLQFLFQGRRRNEQDDKEPRMVQGMSPLQFRSNLVGKLGPDFLLAMAREMNSFIYRSPITRVKVYVVADLVAARTILKNPKHG